MKNQDRARKEYYKARADNIKRQVSIYDVLNHYGVRIRTENSEVQFPCPLHGDGTDNGYSARAYPDEEGKGSHAYCWGCQKARDVIEWVKDKESVSFIQAMKTIEDMFAVQDVPNIYTFFDPSNPEGSEGQESKLTREISSILDKQVTFGVEDLAYIEKKIGRLVRDKKNALSMESILRLYYVYDSVIFDLKTGKLDMSKAQMVLSKLTEKIEALI
jgi:hypothetical protein